MIHDNIIERMKAHLRYGRGKWGIYCDGKLTTINQKSAFSGKGIAKRRILEASFGRYGVTDEHKEALEDLIKWGVIEIRKL